MKKETKFILVAILCGALWGFAQAADATLVRGGHGKHCWIDHGRRVCA